MKWRRPQRRYRKILGQMTGLLLGKSDRRSFLPAYGIIRALRRTGLEFFDRSAIQKTRDDARDLLKQVTKAEAQLSSVSLSPELRLRLGLDTTLSPVEATNSPGGRLLAALAEVKQLSEQAVENQPPDDQIKIWCARIAYSLMYRFSEERITSGSPDSTYRAIAGLLYEILTGEADRDLKRACDDHLRSMRSIAG